MRNGYRSELHPLLLVVFAAITYTLALAALTILTAPAPNRWWINCRLPRLRLARASAFFSSPAFRVGYFSCW